MQPVTHPRNNFDALRLAAALSVLFAHQHALSGLPEPNAYPGLSFGGLGVLVFFCISGFLVTQSWQADPHPVRFFARRLLRLWPALAVVILLTALVLGPLVSTLPPSDYFADPLFRRYFRNLFFSWQDRLPAVVFTGSWLPPSVNGSLWTIPPELVCYVVLAAAAFCGVLRFRWLLVVLAAVAAALYFGPSFGPNSGIRGYHAWDNRRPEVEFGLFFAAGVLLQAFHFHRDRATMLATLGVAGLLAIAAFMTGHPLLALWLAGPVVLLSVGIASSPLLREAGRFGDISYGVYIYAFPVQQTYIWLFKDRLAWTTIFAMTLATVATFAFASWHLVEKRALRLKPARR